MSLAIYDDTGARVSSERIAAIRTGAVDQPYQSGSFRPQELMAWNPPMTSADSAVLPNRDISVARARDIIRNDPIAQSAASRMIEMLVGAGLILSSQPAAEALGLDLSKADHRKTHRALAASIETEWFQFANDPGRRLDSQRRLSGNGMFRLLGRYFVTENECTAFLKWKEGGRYATCVRVIEPDRLSNPYGQPVTQKLRGGIEFDDDGVPVAYHVRNGHPSDWYIVPQPMTWTRIERCTPSGRPVFIHGYESERADQARGMTPFAALIKQLRMVGKFGDTELASATINAMFAAFVKSSLPIGEATAAFTPQTVTTLEGKRLDYWAQNPPTIGGARIGVMPLGDSIEINSSPRQTTAFSDFKAAFHQSIAAALGLSYETLTMDWSKVNYSSARAAMNEVWRHTQMRFSAFVDQVVLPIHYAQLEEAFDRGYIKPPPGAPDFWEMPGAYLQARWIGPGRGYVDPVKEAQGATMRIGGMTSTYADENADLGRDWIKTLNQRANEKEMMEERGLIGVEASGSGLLPDPSESGPETPSQNDKSRPDK